MTEPRGIEVGLARAAAWCGGELVGGDGRFEGVDTDSRQVTPGSLFVALAGERHDGHEHAAEALAMGAAAVLVSRPLDCAAPQIRVDDTRLALGRLAAAWRRELGTPLCAVTGSNGKTTVKEMLAAILGLEGPVLATRGNLNNDIGVPLTLLRLHPSHRFAVIEMGANHPGEIAYLTGLARPDVAVVNNAAAAHLAGFGDIAGVARAKGEIFAGLAADGTAVINADDPHAPLWSRLAAGHRQVRFGLEAEADVGASWRIADSGSDLELRLPDGRFPCRLPLPGRHNVMNALAAAAVAHGLGVGGAAIAAGLAALRPVRGRLQPRPGRSGAHVIDDSYNANPDSLRAGMTVLAAYPGRRLLALGDMGELGEGAAQRHAEAGREAKALGIDALYATGELSRAAVEAFGSGARHFDDAEALAEALRPELGPGVTVLVKGSRAAAMERVADALVGEAN